MTKAKIILDSIAPSNVRLTTFQLTFPRFILPEFNTHRMFSRNASSSRAIPVKKQIDTVRNNPFVPLCFNKNAKGMQGGEAVDATDQETASKLWLEAGNAMCDFAEKLVDLGISKQYANRLLEPFVWTTVVCSATEWANFFALRYHPMAQPEICELAKQMWEVYSASSPKYLQDGDWHLPFVNEFDLVASPTRLTYQQAIKMSVARCARVSYLTHEGKPPSMEEDFALYERLLGSTPIHASPAEHQAQASTNPFKVSGNFRGWTQYRKTLESENVTKFEGPK
jgi:thymidylate synthase ThyX